MTSGDLSVDLTQKKVFVFTKVVSLSKNYPTPFAFVTKIRGFRVLTGAEKAPLPIPSLSEPARNGVK